ncbi:hypothetical protein BTA51_18670 [Hahella sp. CCB-MM4]|uniref:hypothetical protein n=1 Tax=Hahella sp. (strain CCB-MM4) TaxID=1926491 RepID=UPI000BCBEB82|nr:hypothetical protein [Hahella sp. CCB-MM4]OZG72023.1 hypothetical protein BTA51_18670 [Hahella sp. CCB-MM4]
MVEQDRQRYLAQFGVVQWYARRELPGAATSPGFVFAEPEVAAPTRPSALSLVESKPSQPPAASHPKAPAASPQRPNIADIAPLPIDQVAKTLSSGDEDSEASGENVPHSKTDDKAVTYLGCITRNISFVAELVGEILPESMPPEVSLFRNIVSACAAGDTTDMRMFQWPPLPHPGLPGHTAENKWLLVNRWVKGETNDSSMKVVFFGTVPETMSQHAEWVVQPDLRQVLEQPLLKRGIWNTLQPLLKQDSDGGDD